MARKVAIISERADITAGGAERSVIELAEAISALGFEADILAAKGQSSRNTHILCQNVPASPIRYFTFAKILKPHLAKNRYDIIHSVLPFDFTDVYQPRAGTYAESISRNAASYQNKFIASCKKVTAFANLRRTILLRAERRLCRNPNGPVIAALSEYVAEQFKRHYGLDPQRIVVIPNGVKTHRPIDTGQADRLRRQIASNLAIKKTDNPTFFLFAAKNFRLKGLASLMKAMQSAACKTGRQGYLIVAGNGQTHKYQRLAKKFKVHKKTVFLGDVSDIQNLLSITDVAILPTFYDPSSRFVLEAIAAGKPAITTKFNGATDLFVNNRHGKVIDTPENISALTEAINYFTDAENIKKASEEIAADKLTEKISISRVAKQLEALYNSILERRR